MLRLLNRKLPKMDVPDHLAVSYQQGSFVAMDRETAIVAIRLSNRETRKHLRLAANLASPTQVMFGDISGEKYVVEGTAIYYLEVAGSHVQVTIESLRSGLSESELEACLSSLRFG